MNASKNISHSPQRWVRTDFITLKDIPVLAYEETI